MAQWRIAIFARSDHSPFRPSRATLLALAPLATAVSLCVCLATQWGAGWGTIALVPLAIALRVDTVPRPAFAAAFLSGLLVHLVGMAWVLDCYRYDQFWGPYAIQWYWIGMWGGALFFTTFAVGRFVFRRSQLPMSLLLPTLWVAFEFVRSGMSELVTGTAFPWLKLGWTLVDHRQLVQIADLGGEYLLSFLLAMINGAIVDLVFAFIRDPGGVSPRLTTRVVAATVFASLAAIGYGEWRLGQSTGSAGPTIGLLGEMELPPILDADRISAAFARATAAPVHADLLLWPELAYHHPVTEDDHCLAQTYLIQSARQLGSTLAIGCERHQLTNAGVERFNSIACADPRDGFQGCYDKINLVPGAEASMRSAEQFAAGEPGYARGRQFRSFVVPTAEGDYRFTPAVCYDICFGEHVRNSCASDVDFLVHCGSEGQDEEGVVAWLMLRYARLRAIENRRAVARNVTYGHSALIDGNGRVLRVLPTTPIVEPMWLGPIPIDRRWSLYSHWGDWVGQLSFLVLGGMVITRIVWIAN